MKNKFPTLGAVFALSIASASQAALVTFNEDFTGSTLDPAWDIQSSTGGSLNTDTESYELSAVKDTNNSRLFRAGGGSLESFEHKLTISLDNFMGSSSDLRWYSNGFDGGFEFKMNSFGNISINHKDFRPEGGWVTAWIADMNNPNVFENGDSVTFTQHYDQDSDTMSFLYSVNEGADVLVYTGGASDGADSNGFGDTITGVSWMSNSESVGVYLSQWGDSGAASEISISSWSVNEVVSVPEPSSTMLIGLSGVAMLLRRRR